MIARVTRVLVTVAILAAIGAAALIGIQRLTGSGQSGYMVRVVFDNSSFVIPGEQVKVAGVTIGTIHAVQLTEQNQAAVVLAITDPQFEPFRTDAHCAIGIESLLGEQFVQCTATQPHAAGDPPAPPLPAIKSGPDQGEHLLPVQNTTTPVGFDLLNDITRLPQQEALRLIITGLGAGLAGNGQELNAALLRADPALQQTDHVIAVLASEDHTLARLTDESSVILAPLAAQRRHLEGFFVHAGEVAAASAQEGHAIEQNFKDFPAFLHQLRPATQRLNNLALQMTPALQSLQAQAPAIDAAVKGLGPLADSSIPALQTLGGVAHRGETVFPRANTLARQLLALGTPLQPLANDLGSVAQSFDNTGGIEDVMRFIYNYAGTVNGEDALGHYIRSHVALGPTSRTSTAQSGPSQTASFACNLVDKHCPATFAGTASVKPGGPVGTAIEAAVRRAGASSSAGPGAASAKALLNYLLAP